MVQEIQIQEDLKSGFGPARAGPPSVRVVRGRGCNESFRQAVDRSYEAPLGELANQMETLAEEETESCISGVTYGKKAGDPNTEDEGPYGKTKGVKKKQGIFRGLGSMFRFGRHRKSAGATSSAAAAAAALARAQQQEEANRLHEAELAEQLEARNQHHQEQVRKLQHQHQQQQEYLNSVRNPGNYQTPQNYVSFPQHPHQVQGGSMRIPVPHSSRDKTSRKSEAARADKDINGNTNPNHGRSTSFDVYNEMQRPGSRMGIVDPKNTRIILITKKYVIISIADTNSTIIHNVGRIPVNVKNVQFLISMNMKVFRQQCTQHKPTHNHHPVGEIIQGHSNIIPYIISNPSSSNSTTLTTIQTCRPHKPQGSYFTVNPFME